MQPRRHSRVVSLTHRGGDRTQCEHLYNTFDESRLLAGAGALRRTLVLPAWSPRGPCCLPRVLEELSCEFRAALHDGSLPGDHTATEIAPRRVDEPSTPSPGTSAKSRRELGTAQTLLLVRSTRAVVSERAADSPPHRPTVRDYFACCAPYARKTTPFTLRPDRTRLTPPTSPVPYPRLGGLGAETRLSRAMWALTPTAMLSSRAQTHRWSAASEPSWPERSRLDSVVK